MKQQSFVRAPGQLLIPECWCMTAVKNSTFLQLVPLLQNNLAYLCCDLLSYLLKRLLSFPEPHHLPVGTHKKLPEVPLRGFLHRICILIRHFTISGWSLNIGIHKYALS